VQFVDFKSKNGEPVFVNPSLVRWLVQYGEYVNIHFDDGDVVSVKDDVRRVAGELGGASKR
jgi:hypothetical protein